MTSADVLILGGGSGGYACALRSAELGLSVILIDKDKLGGTCLHRGCIPTKALLHAAEVADSSRESENFGVVSTFEGIDMPKVNEYRDGVVARLYKGLQGLVKSRNAFRLEEVVTFQHHDHRKTREPVGKCISDLLKNLRLLVRNPPTVLRFEEVEPGESTNRRDA